MVIPASPSTFDQLLRKGPLNGDVVSGLDELRYKILIDGIPSNSDGMVNNSYTPYLTLSNLCNCKSELRIYIWLILLNSPPIATDVYLDLVRQGASPAYSKIRNDTFRTLATDPLFRRRVTENSLTRVLNAVAWKLQDAHEARINGWLSPPTMPLHNDQIASPDASMHSRSSLAGTQDGSQMGDKTDYVGYVQGMNVLAAPFLYAARSESEAFVAFDRLLQFECPGYIRGSMEGVHNGLKLVDEVLQICDPKLYHYLYSKGLNASIYAFPSVLTMCACTPPLPEVLQLWDFLFAYGTHLNVVCIVAQLVLIRDQILGADRFACSF
jgi:cell cycle arrest protein BUB2